MKTERAPQKDPGKNGKFENSRANQEAQKLVNQWSETQNQEEAKPLPMVKIIVFLAIAFGAFYWFKHGG